MGSVFQRFAVCLWPSTWDNVQQRTAELQLSYTGLCETAFRDGGGLVRRETEKVTAGPCRFVSVWAPRSSVWCPIAYSEIEADSRWTSRFSRALLRATSCNDSPEIVGAIRILMPLFKFPWTRIVSTARKFWHIHCGSKKTRQLWRTITTTQFSRF